MTEVETYIAGFDPKKQEIMQKIRALILKEAPDAVEKMAYGMAGYKTFGKPLVYFAAHMSHIGLYALPESNRVFYDELKPYKRGKGSIQFRIDRPMPYDLIERIVAFRVEENKAKAALKKRKE